MEFVAPFYLSVRGYKSQETWAFLIISEQSNLSHFWLLSTVNPMIIIGLPTVAAFIAKRAPIPDKVDDEEAAPPFTEQDELMVSNDTIDDEAYINEAAVAQGAEN